MKRKIGRTGVESYPIGMGAMPLSIQDRPPEEQGIQVIHAALDAGVDFIDTADVYCLDDNDIGHNERLIARALRLRGNPENVHVATKGGLRRPQGAWVTDGRPSHLREACERSLKALGVDSIFLYQLHAPADNAPFEDSVGELARLKQEGKIRNVGLSNVSSAQLRAAQKIVRIESVQNRFNPLHSDDARGGLIRLCAEQEVTYIAYSPVGGGWHHESLASQPVMQELARKHGASPYRIALAWALAQGENVLPIPGASRVSSIRDSAEAPSVRLGAEDIARIDSISGALPGARP